MSHLALHDVSNRFMLVVRFVALMIPYCVLFDIIFSTKIIQQFFKKNIKKKQEQEQKSLLQYKLLLISLILHIFFDMNEIISVTH